MNAVNTSNDKSEIERSNALRAAVDQHLKRNCRPVDPADGSHPEFERITGDIEE